MKVNRFLLLIIILLAVSVSGCAPAVYKLHSETDSKNIAIVTSAMDSKTEKMIIDRFGDQKRIRYLTLKAVDGKNKKGKEEIRGRYNSVMDGGYVIEVLPGSHTYTVSPSVKTKQHATTDISFIAIKGHTYFLGEAKETKNFLISDKFWWTPVVVDRTTSEFVYPGPEIQVGKEPFNTK